MGLWDVQDGQRSGMELLTISWPNQVSGSMAGSTSRLPLSNTTFGRPLYLPSHLPRTRLICVPTQDMGPAVFSAVAQPYRNSRFSLHCSGRLCWRGCVSPCRSLKQSASVVLGWTGAGATGQHAHGQGGCDPEQLRHRRHWLGCAGRQEQR